MEVSSSVYYVLLPHSTVSLWRKNWIAFGLLRRRSFSIPFDAHMQRHVSSSFTSFPSTRLFPTPFFFRILPSSEKDFKKEKKTTSASLYIDPGYKSSFYTPFWCVRHRCRMNAPRRDAFLCNKIYTDKIKTIRSLLLFHKSSNLNLWPSSNMFLFSSWWPTVATSAEETLLFTLVYLDNQQQLWHCLSVAHTHSILNNILFLYFSKQDLKNQILTTNVWVEHVSKY